MTPDAFLQRTGWEEAARSPVAGDASARRYTRLARAGGDTLILMEDAEGDVATFARIARFLDGLGLSAPQIHAEHAGLLLIEDLGDALFARLANADPEREAMLYKVAIDALVILHAAPPPEVLVAAGPARLAQMTNLAFDWYLPRATGAGDTSARDATIAALRDALARHAPDTDVTILRDFHAENLLWLSARDGPRRAGLLDFQDAMAGHRAYDIVSLLEDARRDVSPATRAGAMRHYLDRTGHDAAWLETAMAVQGAARNLRILGVFARLAVTRAKPHYIDLVPRVWRHLMQDLSHPALADVARHVIAALPGPEQAILNRLKAP